MTRRDSRPLKGALLVLLLVAAHGCATRKPPPVPSPTGKTTQLPASYYNTYYSTQKARTLGETYSDNLDHILEQLTQSSIGKLQFANAVVSLSVGFFTHAASQPPDERYLEAIIGMPDILDEEKDFSTLVGQIFSDYGRELLSTMTQDEAIARETKIAGYGLHFSWRSLLKTPSGPRLSMREAVLYFAKDQTQQFLTHQITQDTFLARATLFSRQGERPAELVPYAPPMRASQPLSRLQPDSREDTPTQSLYDQEPPQVIQPLSTPAIDTIRESLRPVESSPLTDQRNIQKSEDKPHTLTTPSVQRRNKRIIIRRPSHNTAATFLPVPEENLLDDPPSINEEVPPRRVFPDQ
jgi:hypothetical protein